MCRHQWPNLDGPGRPPLWVTATSTNASESSLRDEILRLAEENAALKATMVRKGDIRRAFPIFNQHIEALEAKIATLREENIRLKGDER